MITAEPRCATPPLRGSARRSSRAGRTEPPPWARTRETAETPGRGSERAGGPRGAAEIQRKRRENRPRGVRAHVPRGARRPGLRGGVDGAIRKDREAAPHGGSLRNVVGKALGFQPRWRRGPPRPAQHHPETADQLSLRPAWGRAEEATARPAGGRRHRTGWSRPRVRRLKAEGPPGGSEGSRPHIGLLSPGSGTGKRSPHNLRWETSRVGGRVTRRAARVTDLPLKGPARTHR